MLSSSGAVDILSMTGSIAAKAAIRPAVVNGSSKLVAAVLDTSGASVRAENISPVVNFKGKEIESGHVLRVIYEVKNHRSIIVGADRLELKRPGPLKLNPPDKGWQVFAGVLTMDEVAGLSVDPKAGEPMHHFTMMYDLFKFAGNKKPPTPKHPGHVHEMPGDDLGPPGHCGPPIKP
jgi:hypothetical protein